MNLKNKKRQLKKFSIYSLYLKKKDNQQKEINEQTNTTIDESKWVINLSNYNITEDERELLENGMNFSVTTAALPTTDLIAKIETTLTGMTTEEADTIKQTSAQSSAR